VVGVDLTRASLALGVEASRRFGLKRVRFVETDLRQPALRPGTFDLVYCSGVLHHTPDPRASFAPLVRLARPGGLGSSAREDVSAAPTVTLREAMALAANRDSVAREYATDFATTFEIGVPALRAARSAGLGWSEATVETFLRILATLPDSLIARKLGTAAAAAVSRRAREVEDAGGVRTEAGREALEAFDDELRSPNNAYNPGTTADLTCAALFVVILEDGWHP